jgi:hypothetical protein
VREGAKIKYGLWSWGSGLQNSRKTWIGIILVQKLFKVKLFLFSTLKPSISPCASRIDTKVCHSTSTCTRRLLPNIQDDSSGPAIVINVSRKPVNSVFALYLEMV